MKNKSRCSKEDTRTAQIRATLSFLMFIETKLINKQPYRLASLNMTEIDGFSNYMMLYMPE